MLLVCCCNFSESIKQEFKPRPVHGILVLRPGFEPGSAAREAAILGRTILPELFKIKEVILRFKF